MVLLDGRAAARILRETIKQETEILKNSGKKIPHLAAVLVGDDAASQTYVAAKVTACKKVGFDSTLMQLPKGITQQALFKKIDQLNEDTAIDGFIVQLPLPAHIDEKKSS